MAVTKPIASLSSSLQARKGQAKPAMRPQGYASLAMTNMAPDWPHLAADDLGLGDLRYESYALDAILDDMANAAAQQSMPIADVDAAPEPATALVVKVETVHADVVQADSIQSANEDMAMNMPPCIPVVVEQQRALAMRLGEIDAAPATCAKSVDQKCKTKAEQPNIDKKSAAANKAAFTLRLDEDRHLRLRLASAVSRRSAQRLVTEALDRFLEGLTDIDQLTGHLKTSAAVDRH